MTQEDEDAWRRRGEEVGRMLATLENVTKRIARLENGVIAILTAIAALYLKSVGLW